MEGWMQNQRIRWIDRQTDRQTDRQIDRQIDSEIVRWQIVRWKPYITDRSLSDRRGKTRTEKMGKIRQIKTR